ncbi:FAD-dependent oxidoreductase [candidate division KSB1 bacterium]|nr:FAD-dependent oxidoreductase [candidate division KSB1 bacterium]
MPSFLTDAQLWTEIQKCEYCAEKPCREACPVDCSPADFIMAAKTGDVFDFKRAAAVIYGHNPLGGVCGALCPDYHCMQACVHRTFDHAVNIPAVQATIIQKAKDLHAIPEFLQAPINNANIAIIGAGPSGMGAAAVLAQIGYSITMYEKQKTAGGMCNLIPDVRFNKNVLLSDIEFFKSLGKIRFELGAPIADPLILLNDSTQAVIVCAGLDEPLRLNIPGEKLATAWNEFLAEPPNDMSAKKVAIIGGGAVALDCALVAKQAGAETVEMICLENPAEMPLTEKERTWLLEAYIDVINRSRINEIKSINKELHINLSRVKLPAGEKFQPKNMQDIPNSGISLGDYQQVIIAIGGLSSVQRVNADGIFYAGDMVNGPTTVVEAVAAGKNIALEVDAYLQKKSAPIIEKRVKARNFLNGRNLIPINLHTEFFGRKIRSPFILSAAPPTDGYEQMKKAYDAGWAGGVMKTAFDNVPIHIPSEYIFVLNKSTYGNCDNVSGHPLDRVCDEIGRLTTEYPDRLTIASTGGAVTGNDAEDRKSWQSNTSKLEQAGVMAIEYSLSCPQGGDGTKGDIVSQDAELTAKIVDWVMEISHPDIPKLFKLTGAVTAIYPILDAIKQVFAKYPNKKAGVTLANTFPALSFRRGNKTEWDEGIVIGMSGDGVQEISNLTLANAAKVGLTVSGNGGPMNYKAAADFLALGAETVQFCTIVLKYGYGIIDELHSGLSYLLEAKGFSSVKQLIGCALPNPVTGFMDLSPLKKISAVDRKLCQHCGNCTRCPYMAIELDSEKIPIIDASKCIGCSLCVQKCFSGALFMRERTGDELAVLKED